MADSGIKGLGSVSYYDGNGKVNRIDASLVEPPQSLTGLTDLLIVLPL